MWRCFGYMDEVQDHDDRTVATKGRHGRRPTEGNLRHGVAPILF